MPIVDGNRRIEPIGHGTVRAPQAGEERNMPTKKFDVKRKGLYDLQMHVFRKDGDKTLENMALVREHFGLNVSDTLRLALHLTANMIRADKAHVEVE